MSEGKSKRYQTKRRQETTERLRRYKKEYKINEIMVTKGNIRLEWSDIIVDFNSYVP